MKKNEFASFLVYIAMLAIAIVVGIFVIRPVLLKWDNKLEFLWVILFILGGAVFNSLLLELGHVVGGKIGKMDIWFFCVLGFAIKKDNKGKTSFKFSAFDGLTGQTRFLPKDVEKSSAPPSIAFPLFLYLLEVVGGVFMIAISERNFDRGTVDALWMKAFAVIFLSLGRMIYLYNYFPAHLDSPTDGYRMTLLNKPINKVAYNHLLVNEYRSAMGLPLEDTILYDELTDFTAQVNMTKVYDELSKNNIAKALGIIEKTLENEEAKLSQNTVNRAMAMKLSLVLLTTKKGEGAEYYETIDDEDRKYIANLSDGPSLRCYLLISGVLEGSETETKYALAKKEKILKRTPESEKKVEEKLIELTITRIKNLHPSWEI